MASFLQSTYRRRLDKVRAGMRARSIDLLIVPSPDNINYLTGFDGWSFYLNQCLLVEADRATPVWIGRGSDAAEAASSPVIDSADVLTYGDEYIQSQTLHPYDFVADKIAAMGWSTRRIGLPLDAYYFPVRGYMALQRRLGEARLVDDGDLINWLRVYKEPDEIDCMTKAAAIAARAILQGADAIAPGLRRCDTAAAMLQTLTAPSEAFGGEYPAIQPLIIDGEGPARPHTTWSEQRYDARGTTILEVAGVYRRYHCPIARTVSIGAPDTIKVDAARAQIACLTMIEQTARPGLSCGDLAALCSETLQEHGFSKKGRFGYSTGLAYPPDWGEHTISVRAGETSRIEAGMTLFFIPALWGESWSVGIGETFAVSDAGARRLSTLPYDLIVR